MNQIFEKIYSKSKQEFVTLLSDNAKKNVKTFVVTANPETIAIANKNNTFQTLLEDNITTIVPDGIGLVKGMKLLGLPVTERIPGIDLMEELLKIADNQEKTIYLFGAKEEVVAKLLEIIGQKYPNIKVIGASHGYIQNRDEIKKDLEETQPDIVFVALGIPHQEQFIYSILPRVRKGIYIGVGGSFDTISGYKKRAPKVFISLNLEWLYRIGKEPKRITRFLSYNLWFLKFILKNKRKKNK